MAPAVPARSPLRPRPSPLTPSQEHNSPDITIVDDVEDDMTYYSLNSLTTLVDKPLPQPDRPLSPPLTKRQHALHELLSSERAYASDLALICEVHIPLALGQHVPLPNLPVSPPNSSGSSSRTLSTASDSSTPDLGPPMTEHDVKVIFGNINEIAEFSDVFCRALEEALGDLVEGGKGDDHVGALFLNIIPELEQPYKQYITRHPTALTHLQQLPQTPAVQNYLSYTQTIASSLSHAWDISSLLIKPVQRLLKYPLLLIAIIDETPDTHPDKENLLKARQQIQEVARNVNEGRRRAEVIREVLAAKKKPVSVTVSASVNLTKMKSLRVAAGVSGKSPSSGNKDEQGPPEEAILVARLEKELKQIEDFAQKFAKNIVEWARMTSNFVAGLRTWALGFARVIGLSGDQASEAFDAFLTVVEAQLMPLCVDLEAVINERVLKELAHLLMTMTQPLKLLASMNEQEPYHYHLMNMNVSQKNRPPPSLLAASTNYLALRGQLAAELPTYITLLHRGLKIFIQRLSAIQTEFWGKVHEQWAGLWEMLRLEEELNAGYEETVSVWYARWSEIDEQLAARPIVQQRKLYRGSQDRDRDRDRDREQKDRERERERGRERGREKEQGRERKSAPVERERRDDPEADAEYYTYHHLLTFAHHREHSVPPPPNSRSSARPPPPLHSSSSPSTIYSDVPNTPSSFATSFTSSISGGGVTERGDRLDKDKGAKEKEKKKSASQAANVYSMLGALEPSSIVGAVGGLAYSHSIKSKATSTTSQRERGSSDLSIYGSMNTSILSSVGLGLGSTLGGGGGGGGGGSSSGRKKLKKKGSDESLKTAKGHGQASQPQVSNSARSAREHMPRRRTTGGIEPGPDDLKQYEAMMMRERELGGQPHLPKGSGNSSGNPNGNGGYAAHPHPYQHGHGLPRTKSMPLPYHPQPQPQQRQSQGPDSRRDAGEWSDFADEEDSELFYQVMANQSQVAEYGGEESEQRPARPRERKDVSRLRGAPSNPTHARQQSIGKEDDKKRYSEHSTYSSKSREEKREKDRDKPSSSRKRSGSIKSITSFFTSNRDGNYADNNSSPTATSTTVAPSPRDSWAHKPAKYTCQVIHPCKPPMAGSVPISYFSFPFFTLKEGELYAVLQEAGHPSVHPNLPLIVDNGEDCLLLCRAWDGSVGWAFASFLEPVDIPDM